MTNRVVIGASLLGRRVVFRLEPEHETNEPALARGLGYALTHLHVPRSDGERGVIAAVGRGWQRDDDVRCTPEQARDELREVVSGAGAGDVEPGVVLPVLRRVEPWAHAHGGVPELADTRPEVVGLYAGLRSLLKWEADPESTQRLGEALEADGFHVADGPDGTLFAASRRDRLSQALDAEARLRVPDEEDVASRWFGEALGYPACCVSAYLDQTSRDDVSLALAALPLGVSRLPTAPPQTTWIHGGLSLVSHVPCSPWCTQTEQHAERLLDAYDARFEGFARRWREAAAAIHVVDEAGAASSCGSAFEPSRSGWEQPPSSTMGRRAALWADHRG